MELAHKNVNIPVKCNEDWKHDTLEIWPIDANFCFLQLFTKVDLGAAELSKVFF